MNAEEQHDQETQEQRGSSVWLALLIGLIAAECAVAIFTHRSEAELKQAYREGPRAEQVEALFVLTSRDAGDADDRPEAAALLQSDNPLLREWTMTGCYIGFDKPQAQAAYLASLPRGPEAVRCRFVLAGRSRQLTNMALGMLTRFMQAGSKASRRDAAVETWEKDAK